ncbi:MAG: Gfo/Idh/MocA family oxidoreductase [Bacteroidales bacterium]|nr:Gfo/Idh/MocA family oxidoreductase [Bacteroidales bacterium]
MKRRDFLKSCGLLVAAGSTMSLPSAQAAAPSSAADNKTKAEPLTGLKPIRDLVPETDHPVTVIIIGCGSRGTVYARYAEKFPQGMKVVGVADMQEGRRNYLGDKHNVPAEMRFADFRDVFATKKKLADAVVIATPDNLHYAPAMMALNLDYDILLEKPVAPTEKECKDIRDLAKKKGRIVGVCHVLRYAPYFVALREVAQSGMIGDIVSIQHMESIQYAHMAHSYVRGNWRRSKDTTPIILAKSCHDLDILRWIINKPCKTITADGDLYFFKKENAPEGAPAYCTDGCPHADTCPYNAVTIYCKWKEHTSVFDLHGKDKKDPEKLLSRMKDPKYNRYARCVFHCDNDQPDHYVADMVFEDNITASFTMDAFTIKGGRRTRIMGTKGYIDGDMKEFHVWDFLTRKEKYWNMYVAEIPEYADSGHGGGDHRLVRDFVEAVAHHDPNRLSSDIDVSMESHMMGFAAERSRRTGKKEKI